MYINLYLPAWLFPRPPPAWLFFFFFFFFLVVDSFLLSFLYYSLPSSLSVCQSHQAGWLSHHQCVIPVTALVPIIYSINVFDFPCEVTQRNSARWWEVCYHGGGKISLGSSSLIKSHRVKRTLCFATLRSGIFHQHCILLTLDEITDKIFCSVNVLINPLG